MKTSKCSCLDIGATSHGFLEGIWCAHVARNLEAAAEKCHCIGSGVRFLAMRGVVCSMGVSVWALFERISNLRFEFEI